MGPGRKARRHRTAARGVSMGPEIGQVTGKIGQASDRYRSQIGQPGDRPDPPEVADFCGDVRMARRRRPMLETAFRISNAHAWRALSGWRSRARTTARRQRSRSGRRSGARRL
jgi:hypothetical protein